MSKLLKVMTGLILASLVLAACGGGATQTQAPAVPTTAPSMPEPTTPPEPMADEMCMGAQPGDEISMLYQWSGQEEERLNQILQPLVETCGIVLKPESTRDQALLDTRVTGGNPPDIAFWQVTQLVQYKDQLKTMDSLGANRDNYDDFFIEPMTVDGKWLGLPVKSDIKSIIWYSPVNFEAFGYSVPTTWQELNTLVDQMVADGNVPWSMGFESGDATGWTASDFIQDILLYSGGPELVNGIIDGSVPYNSPEVELAYLHYYSWVTTPGYSVGGAEGALSTPFLAAIYKPFADPPEAMMVKQSGFAGGEIQKQFPDLVYGTDYDFFVFPGLKGLQGSVEPMMAFNDTPAVRALVAYLSSLEGGANWAKAGFDLSPNKGAAGNYTDPALLKKGDALANTQGFTPDIGDTIPGGFGSAEWKAIVDFVSDATDVKTALAQAAAVQAEALK